MTSEPFLQSHLRESYLHKKGLFLTRRTDVFEGGGCSHTKGLLQLSNQLPGIQSITEVDETGGTVDHWDNAKPGTNFYFSKA